MKYQKQSLLALLALTQMLQAQQLGSNKVSNTAETKVQSAQTHKQQSINVNAASLKDLERLPGVGKTLAIRIVERRKIKPFQRIEDLKYVEGIGEKKFAKLKDQVRIN